MKIDLALPPSKRDLRLDLFRGLANWLMFLGHVSTSVLAWFSFRNYGFSDGADLFVFISGYTSALVFGRRMLEGGFVFGTTRLLRRVWQIYAAHILLFVIYLASVHFLSSRFNASDLIDRFNVAPLLNAPGGNDHVGAVAPIQAAEPGCAAALRRPDGHLSAGSLADAQAPELGHPWIGIALFPSPTIWLEFVLLSVGCLVFQPVRVAASFRAGSVA